VCIGLRQGPAKCCRAIDDWMSESEICIITVSVMVWGCENGCVCVEPTYLALARGHYISGCSVMCLFVRVACR
jgi:hypothetical protein